MTRSGSAQQAKAFRARRDSSAVTRVNREA